MPDNKLTHEKFDKMVEEAATAPLAPPNGGQAEVNLLLQKAREVKSRRGNRPQNTR